MGRRCRSGRIVGPPESAAASGRPWPGDKAMGKVFERVVSDGAPFEGAHRLSRQVNYPDASGSSSDGLNVGTDSNTVDGLERLQQLHAKGFLTDDEFSAAKANLLA